jgi:hypothetical protein
MPSYDVAHVREQGVDLIVVPLDRTFGNKTPQEQDRFRGELQVRSKAAGLAGTIVPVWDAGGGRMAFIAQPNWFPFFQSINLLWVAANINRKIFW